MYKRYEGSGNPNTPPFFKTGALVAGIFGMNVTNTMEEGPYSFPFFLGIVCIIGFVILVGGGSIMLWMWRSRILVQ